MLGCLEKNPCAILLDSDELEEEAIRELAGSKSVQSSP